VLSEGGDEDGLDRVQAVLGLVEDDAVPGDQRRSSALPPKAITIRIWKPPPNRSDTVGAIW
jgi:hypothetical protein